MFNKNLTIFTKKNVPPGHPELVEGSGQIIEFNPQGGDRHARRVTSIQNGYKTCTAPDVGAAIHLSAIFCPQHQGDGKRLLKIRQFR